MLCLYGTETQVLSRIANLYHENKHPRYQSISCPIIISCSRTDDFHFKNVVGPSLVKFSKPSPPA